MTVVPSMSGRPRSRTMTLKGCWAAARRRIRRRCGGDGIAVGMKGNLQGAEDVGVVVDHSTSFMVSLPCVEGWVWCRAGGRTAPDRGLGRSSVKGYAGGERQADHHREPAAGCLFGGECAAHRFGEAFGHGQAEPDAGGLRDVVEPLEGLEHSHDAFCGDALAVVDDAQFPCGLACQCVVLSPPAAPTMTMSESGAYLTAFSTMLAMTRSSIPASASTSGMLARQVHPDPAGGDAVQGGLDDFVPADGLMQRVDGVRGDPGHVQQVAHQGVQPVGAFVDGGEQFLFLLGGVVDVGLSEAADGEFDAGQGCAQVVGDGTEDGGAHGVAFGQAEDFAAAGRQLLAFQLRCQVDAERAQQAPVAGRQDPA